MVIWEGGLKPVMTINLALDLDLEPDLVILTWPWILILNLTSSS
jgi:hypothetical protein